MIQNYFKLKRLYKKKLKKVYFNKIKIIEKLKVEKNYEHKDILTA